jgi:hypothetical protein
MEVLLDRVDGGAGACLAVEGEPGIGKSSLLGELRRCGEARGYRVLAATAAEFERDVPFGVWEEALDGYGSSDRWGAVPRWDRDMSGEPALAEEGGGVATLPDERYRTHRAVRALLERIAADVPLVVVLDDVHWFDDASVEVLVSLLHRPPRARVLIALGYRSGRAPAALAPALAAAVASVLELAPLSEEQCARLAEGVPDAQQRAFVVRESGGNPFYALELARAVRLRGGRDSVRDRVAAQAGVPLLVASAILDEVHSVSPRARLALECASIAGDPFEPELAFAIAELDSGTGLQALDELLDADLVRRTTIARRFAFRHPLVRRAVYESTKGGWRLGAHARAAVALAAGRYARDGARKSRRAVRRNRRRVSDRGAARGG